jgi:glycosyltransferase involved in cell wall biosynthesis
MKKVVIFIPCYNEIENISNVINKINDFRKNNNRFIYEILIVDDGSDDGLNKIIKDLKVDYYYRNKVNLGLGATTRIGMECAHYVGGQIFVKFDADMQHRVEDIERIANAIDENDLDIVYGSRFKGKINYRMPLHRKVGNLFFTRLMRLLTRWDISDAQTGLMCFSRNYLTRFEMPSTYNPPQQALIDGKSKRMAYGEIIVEFDKRMHGVSFVSVKYIYKVFSALLKILYANYSYKILVGSSFIMIGFISIDFFSKLFSGQGIVSEFYISFVQRSLFLGIFSIILLINGLQSFSILNRVVVNRNTGNYLYINTDELRRLI